jgi:hypothetical protein
VPGFGKAQLATIAGAKGRHLSIAWGVAGDQIRMAVAEDAQPLLSATPAKGLQDVPFAKTAIERIDGASLVAVVQLGKERKPDAAVQPVVLSWGRRADGASEYASLRLSATHPALRDLLRRELGL